MGIDLAQLGGSKWDKERLLCFNTIAINHGLLPSASYGA